MSHRSHGIGFSFCQSWGLSLDFPQPPIQDQARLEQEWRISPCEVNNLHLMISAVDCTETAAVANSATSRMLMLRCRCRY